MWSASERAALSVALGRVLLGESAWTRVAAQVLQPLTLHIAVVALHDATASTATTPASWPLHSLSLLVAAAPATARLVAAYLGRRASPLSALDSATVAECVAVLGSMLRLVTAAAAVSDVSARVGVDEWRRLWDWSPVVALVHHSEAPVAALALELTARLLGATEALTVAARTAHHDLALFRYAASPTLA